ncbi:MAG: hypothetical protein RL591_479 [Planctomycetota bacterium]|jgi:quercetin dioxygenase-like cupin family protein
MSDRSTASNPHFGSLKAYIRAAGEGYRVDGPVGGDVIFKARSADTGGMLMAMENHVHPGEGPPLHLHPSEDEYFWVLEGEFRFRTNNDVATAGTGAFVFVPRGTPHCFQNVGAQLGRLLVLFTPSGMESFYENLAQLKGDRSPEAFARAGSDAKMQVVGPTLAESHPRTTDAC